MTSNPFDAFMLAYGFVCVLFRPGSPTSAKDLSLTASEVFDKTDGNGAVASVTPIHETRHTEDVVSNHNASPNGRGHAGDDMVRIMDICLDLICNATRELIFNWEHVKF